MLLSTALNNARTHQINQNYCVRGSDSYTMYIVQLSHNHDIRHMNRIYACGSHLYIDITQYILEL